MLGNSPKKRALSALIVFLRRHPSLAVRWMPAHGSTPVGLLYEAVKVASQEDDHAAAIRLCEGLLERDPRHAGAIRLKWRSLRATQGLAEAERFARSELDEWSAAPERLLYDLASMAYRGRDWEAAVRWSRRVMERNPLHVPALRIGLRSLQTQGRLEEAEAFAVERIRHGGLPDEVLEEIDRLARVRDGATCLLRMSEELLRENPAHVPGLLLRIRALRETGRHQAAMQACCRLLRESDAPPAGVASEVALLAGRGVDTSEALRWSRRVLEEEPGHEVALLVRLALLRGAGQMEEAERLASRALAEGPAPSERVLYAAAELAWDAADFATVLARCDRLLSLNPTHAQGIRLKHQAAIKHLEPGALREETHDWVGRGSLYAKAATETAVKMAFEDSDWAQVAALCRSQEAPRWEWRVRLASALARIGDVQGAEDTLRDLHRDYPEDDQSDLTEAAVAWQLGDGARQLRAYNRVLQRHGFAPVESIDPAQRLNIQFLRCEPPGSIEDGPLVSVIMTAYRRDALLDVAIDSILGQTYRALELIVVDDRSPDDAYAHLSHRAAGDSRMKVLQTLRNSGPYLAKNEGLHVAQGEFLAFMDSDDWSHPQRIARQVHVLESDPRRAGVFHQSMRVDASGGFRVQGRIARPAEIALMVRREVQERVGFFDAVRVSADREFIERIRAVYGGDCLIEDPIPSVLMTAHAGSLTGGGPFKLAWHGPTAPRLAYRAAFRAWHRRLAARGEHPYISHPLGSRPFEVPPEFLADADADPASPEPQRTGPGNSR